MSNESGWTPGPWHHEVVGAGTLAICAEGETLSGPPYGSALALAEKSEPHGKANAYLIAAAPSMADALTQWRNAEEAGDAEELANARQARDKALAQAMGEQR